jgi:hypothetical protein
MKYFEGRCKGGVNFQFCLYVSKALQQPKPHSLNLTSQSVSDRVKQRVSGRHDFIREHLRLANSTHQTSDHAKYRG